MKLKYLDIACAGSPHFLAEALEGHDQFYVGVDMRPVVYSPEVVFWNSKQYLMDNSFYEAGLYGCGRSRAIDDMVNDVIVSSCLIDIIPEERQDLLSQQGYKKGLDYYALGSKISALKAKPEMAPVLDACVSELIYDDEKIVRVFHDIFQSIREA